MKIFVPEKPLFIMDVLKEKGFNSYLVGGCVRDAIMGLNANDYDIASDALPEDVINIFRNCGFGYTVIETGIKHGTVTIVMGSDKKDHYEVTTFREDIYESDADHRRPSDVKFSKDIITDLSRRDFTINALAADRDGNILDPFNGMKDLQTGIIQCVGNPLERFEEDALRMLRAIRFACRFNFKIEERTWKAITILSDTLQHISKERIRDEFCKTITTDYPSVGLRLFNTSGLLKFVMPDLIPCVGFEQHNEHHDKNIFDHILSVVENSPNRLDVRLAAVLHDIGKPKSFEMGDDGQGHFYRHHLISSDLTNEILLDLKFDNVTINKICILVREHMSRYDKLRVSNTKRFISRVGIDNLEDLFDLQIADIKGSALKHQDFSGIEFLKSECQRILNEKQPLGLKDLAINGSDLIKLGFKPGIELGLKLKELMELVLEDQIVNEKEILIKYVLESK